MNDRYVILTAVSDGACTLSSSYYVPKSGMYSVETVVYESFGTTSVIDVKTNKVLIDGTKTIDQQSFNVSGPEAKYTAPFGIPEMACQYLLDDSNHRYMISTVESGTGLCASSASPLPPTPAPPDTSCTLNDGNALNVNLNNVDRSQIPTVPGSGSMRHIQVPVECTGGDVTVNMKLNYTPISLSAGEVIKSSSNGLGVSVVYDSKILSSTDITPVTFLAGSNSMDLAFQAVRDPTVEIKDVPTGAFTASAVLVMTQQ